MSGDIYDNGPYRTPGDVAPSDYVPPPKPPLEEPSADEIARAKADDAFIDRRVRRSNDQIHQENLELQERLRVAIAGMVEHFHDLECRMLAIQTRGEPDLRPVNARVSDLDAQLSVMKSHCSSLARDFNKLQYRMDTTEQGARLEQAIKSLALAWVHRLMPKGAW